MIDSWQLWIVVNKIVKYIIIVISYKSGDRSQASDVWTLYQPACDCKKGFDRCHRLLQCWQSARSPQKFGRWITTHLFTRKRYTSNATFFRPFFQSFDRFARWTRPRRFLFLYRVLLHVNDGLSNKERCDVAIIAGHCCKKNYIQPSKNCNSHRK